MRISALCLILSGCATLSAAAPGLEQCQTAAVAGAASNLGPVVAELLANGTSSAATQTALEQLAIQTSVADVACSISALGVFNPTPTPPAGQTAAPLPNALVRARTEATSFLGRHTHVVLK